MTISLTKFEEGLFKYIDTEICPKLSDWRKWAFPFLIGTTVPVIEDYYNKFLPQLKQMQIVDESNMIDLDKLYENLHTVADRNGEIIQQIPMLGEVRFSSRDVDSLYRILRGFGEGLSSL